MKEKDEKVEQLTFEVERWRVKAEEAAQKLKTVRQESEKASLGDAAKQAELNKATRRVGELEGTVADLREKLESTSIDVEQLAVEKELSEAKLEEVELELEHAKAEAEHNALELEELKITMQEQEENAGDDDVSQLRHQNTRLRKR